MSEKVVPFRQREKLALYDTPTLVGEINAETSEVLSQLIEAEAVNHKTPIDVVVKSRGGNVEDALVLIQDINRIRETYGVKIRMIAKGYADSSATLLVAMGDERIAYSDTEFLLHEPRLTTEEPGTETLTEARREAYETRRLQRRTWKMLSKRTGKSIQEIKELEKQEKSITSQQAMEFGLIDRIVVFER